MRVALVFSDLTFPPKEGLHRYFCDLLRLLSDNGCEVHIYAFCKDPNALDVKGLEAHTGGVLAAPIVKYRGSTLLLAARLRFLPNILLPTGTSNVRDSLVSGHYAIAHLLHIAACFIVPGADAGVVLDVVDPGSLRQARMARSTLGTLTRAISWLASELYKYLENSLDSPDVRWHVVSSPDAEYLNLRLKSSRAVAIPPCLPIPIATPQAEESQCSDSSTSIETRLGRRILVLADLRYAHMIDAVERLGYAVVTNGSDKLAGGFSFVILSRAPPDERMMSAWERVDYQFIEWVSDYDELVSAVDIVVMPDRVGSGIKVRAVHCLALGKVIVGTKVAFEGIALVDGQDAYIAEDASGIVQILNNIAATGPDGQMPVAARIASAPFDRDRVSRDWLALYREAIAVRCEPSKRPSGQGG